MLCRKNRGFSLIELMISLTLGLLILLMLGRVYLTANNTSQLSDDLVDLSERVRIISKVIDSNITNAGYVDLFDGGANLSESNGSRLLGEYELYQPDSGVNKSPIQVIHSQSFPIYVCRSGFSDVIDLDEPPACDSNGNTSDAFQLTFQAVRAAPPPVTSTVTVEENSSLQSSDGYIAEFSGAGLDCQGEEIKTVNGFVINRFFLKDNALHCISSISNTVSDSASEMLKNVAQLNFFYKVLSTEKIAGGAFKSAYFSPEDALDRTKNPRGIAGITGIKICLVVYTDENSLEIRNYQPQVPSCTISEGTIRAQGDNKTYRKFELTYAIPNALFVTN